MKIKIPQSQVRLMVEMTIDHIDCEHTPETLSRDLVGELVKIKSGWYENQFYGNIVSTELISVGQTEEEFEDSEDDTE